MIYLNFQFKTYYLKKSIIINYIILHFLTDPFQRSYTLDVNSDFKSLLLINTINTKDHSFINYGIS